VIIALSAFGYLCREHFSLREDYVSQCEKLAEEKAKVDQFAMLSRTVSERSSFLNSATTKRIKLKGCEATPDAEVLVYKCKLSGKMMLQPIELPHLPVGNYYEVWAQHPGLTDRMIGQLIPPIRYDSLYVLDTAIDYSILQISSVDPVHQLSEAICLATINK
jgi:hypothetical protein